MGRTLSSPSNARHLLVILVLSLVVSSTLFAHAGFTKTTCVATECIQQNGSGVWCYIPISGLTQTTSCDGGVDHSTDFATVIEVHLAQSLSIAYYNGVDNSFLGGADYPISANPGIIRLCASGRSGDGNLQTLCVNAIADNAFANTPYCHVLRGQNNVSDGCYEPDQVFQHPSESPTPTTSYAPSGLAGGSRTVTVTVTHGIVGSGAQMNAIPMHGLLLLAIMVCVTLKL